MSVPHLEPRVAPPRRDEAVQWIAEIDRGRVPICNCAGMRAPRGGHR
jgi:hypothetical protein